jgi:hypothetical protein
VLFQNEKVAQRPFHERLNIVRRSIVDVRDEAVRRGLIDRRRDPFSIRVKEFYDLSATRKVTLAKQSCSQLLNWIFL